MYKNAKIFYGVFLFTTYATFLFSQEQKDDINEVVSGLKSQDESKIEKAYLALIDDYRQVKREYRNNQEVKEAIWIAFKFLVPKPISLRTDEGGEGSSVELDLLYRMGDINEKRAIPYLLMNIYDQGCDNVLAKMGDSVVDPV